MRKRQKNNFPKILGRVLTKAILLVLLVSPLGIESTGSFFQILAQSAGNSFTAGDWVAPSTSVSPLAAYTNAASFDLDYTATDSFSGVDHLNLYVSYNGGPFIQYGGDFSPGETINFDSTTVGGDGAYSFYTIGTDKFTPANVEAAPLSPDTTTIVDTVSPTASLSVSGSWTKLIEEKITNGDFAGGDLSGWTKAGEVAIVPNDSGYAARIGDASDPGNWVWENRLMQSFAGGAKSLAIDYDFQSNDAGPFDDPGFFIRLNGQEIFHLNTLGANSGWQQFVYDLSSFAETEKLNLGIYAGNTGDQDNQSWAYISKVSTYFVAAPAAATYNLIGADSLSGIDHCEYQIDSGSTNTGNSFTVPAPGTHTLQYRCLDRAGNSSPINEVTVITDATAPAAVVDLTVDVVGSNSAVLSWHAPGNDGGSGRASSYDIRYSASLITAANFEAAAKIDRVPAPKDYNELETLEVLGLNPDTQYWFALKAADEAPNISLLSNVVTATTLVGSAVNAGDVVINELMWMGSSLDSGDEWVELRNLTGRTVDLSGFYLTKDSGWGETVMFTFPGGASLPPGGYLIVSEFATTASALKNEPDYVVGNGGTDDPTFSLHNTNLDIKLYDSSGNELDRAWNQTAPTEGLHDDALGRHYSMERTAMPGDGSNPLSWYTAIDEASTADFFDGGADERGTPGATNRSENEPPVQKISSPSAALQLAEDGKSLNFKVTAIEYFTSLNYELTYTTDLSPQGVMGSVELKGEQEYIKDGIIFGTCSTGGTCVYHQGVKNINLRVVLTRRDGQILNLNSHLN